MSVMDEDKAIRVNFSISKEYIKVNTLLAEMPRGVRSRFICEAILHFDEYKNDPDWLLKKIGPLLEMTNQYRQVQQQQQPNNIDQAFSNSDEYEINKSQYIKEEIHSINEVAATSEAIEDSTEEVIEIEAVEEEIEILAEDETTETAEEIKNADEKKTVEVVEKKKETKTNARKPKIKQRGLGANFITQGKI